MKILNAKVWTDGKSSPNPGVSTYGFRIRFYDMEWQELPDYMIDGYGKLPGIHTNNEAEYTAWIAALQAMGAKLDGGIAQAIIRLSQTPVLSFPVLEGGPDYYKVVHFHTDSELMYNQNTGAWMEPFNKIRTPRAMPPRKRSEWNAKIRKPELQRMKNILWAQMDKFPALERICLSLLPRLENSEADALTNLAMETLKEGEYVLNYKEEVYARNPTDKKNDTTTSSGETAV